MLQPKLPRLASHGATEPLGANAGSDASQLAIAPGPLPAGHAETGIRTREEAGDASTIVGCASTRDATMVRDERQQGGAGARG